MLFTPTAKYLSYANAAARMCTWAVYVKKTTDISEALSTGTWVNVTDKVDLAALADQMKRIEYEIGQSTSDSLTIDARDIAWWKANVFNASASEYLEAKVQFTLSQGADVCTDTVYTFCGFIDKIGVQYREIGDAVKFRIFTAQDLGARIAGENVTTQYIETDIDGAGTSGLILNEIIGMYVKDANVSSYVLKAGVHTITYEHDGGRRAKLDAGRWVTLSDGDNTLGNAEDAADDTERLLVYVPETNEMSLEEASFEDTVIVTTPGTTLPQQWFKWAGVRYLLRNIFSKLGITDIAFDAMEIDIAPSPAPAIPKVSFVDNPPDDEAINGKEWAICTDKTDLYIAVGHRVYQRTTADDSYTLLATLTSGDRISKLMYNERNGHLWIFYGNNANGNGKLRRFILSSSTLSSEITLSTTHNDTWHYAIEVFDFEYTAGSWHYSVVYANNGVAIEEVDGSSLSIGTVVSAATVSPSTIRADFLYCRYTSDIQDGRVYFKGTAPSPFFESMYLLTLDSSNVWVYGGSHFSGTERYNIAAYSIAEDRIYFWTMFGSDKHIASHTADSPSKTVSWIETGSALNYAIETVFYAEDGFTYWTLRDIRGTPSIGRLLLYGTDSHEDVSATEPLSRVVYTEKIAMTYLDGALWGIDRNGRLWQYGETVKFYVETADFRDMTVTDALNQTLQGFNLMGKISSMKKGLVYRRGNSTGTPQTTGNTLSVTITEASDIEQEVGKYSKVALVVVDNGITRYTFDGTTYGANVLSDARTLSISNPLIPDEIVQDMCYYTYQFFKTDRTLYRFRLGVLPLFQFEPFDNCNVTLTTTKIALTATSGTSRPIYSTKVSRDGSMEVEVLI